MCNNTTEIFEVTTWAGYNIFSFIAWISSCIQIGTALYLINYFRKLRFQAAFKILFVVQFLGSMFISITVFFNYSIYMIFRSSVTLGQCGIIRNFYLACNIFVHLCFLIFTITVAISTIRVNYEKLPLARLVIVLCTVAFFGSTAFVSDFLQPGNPDELQPHCLSISGSSLGHSLYLYLYSAQLINDTLVFISLAYIFLKNKEMRKDYENGVNRKHNLERNLNALHQFGPAIGITAALVAISTFAAIILRHYQDKFTQAEYMYYAYFFFFGPHIPLVQNVISIVMFRKQLNKIKELPAKIEYVNTVAKLFQKIWKCDRPPQTENIEMGNVYVQK